MATFESQLTTELDGRQYVASSASVPMVYPFAVDEEAKQNNDKMHGILKTVVGANYYGPVGEVLAEAPDRVKSAVDLGCGSGKWVIEMAEEFPHAQFVGLDIVLPSDRTAPANVRFEQGDIRKQTPFEDGAFDIVHIRYMVLATTDYQALLAEAARILRPGGLLLAAEFSWHNQLDLSDTVPLHSYVPAYIRFLQTLGNFTQRAGVHTVAEEVPIQIRGLGFFKDDNSVVHTLPIGNQQLDENEKDLGKRMAEHVLGCFRESRWMFKAAGWTDEQFDELMTNCAKEICAKPGVLYSYYITHARKI